MKTQGVRLLDVFVFGPIMLAYSLKGNLSRTEKRVLALIGIGTVIYNLRNFLIEQQRAHQ